MFLPWPRPTPPSRRVLCTYVFTGLVALLAAVGACSAVAQAPAGALLLPDEPLAAASSSAIKGSPVLSGSATAELTAPDASAAVPAAGQAAASAQSSSLSALPPTMPESATTLPPRPARITDPAARNTRCEEGTLPGKQCRVSWSRILAESLFLLSAQHGGNIAMDHDTRLHLTSGNFWGNYVYCVEHYRWSRWKDDDPFGVDYIGHPMMGAMTNSIYEQNDPKQRALTFENSRRYWMGRLRATAYSAVYSAQWKVGPVSEASIGNTGIGYYIRQRDGVYTNETGMQDFFMTPIGGLAWNVGEDVIDRYLLSRVRRSTHNRLLLLASAFATPGRSGANASRFRAPYYRDPELPASSTAVR